MYVRIGVLFIGGNCLLTTGPWYPSTLWGQPQQSHPPYSLHYPACAGGYGYFGAPQPLFDSSLSGQPHQSGIIALAAKLSQKHRQMWEAQVCSNVSSSFISVFNELIVLDS